MERKVQTVRKLMWFTLGFGGACAFGAYLYGGIFLIPGACILLFGASLCALASLKWKPVRSAGMILLGCALGFGWFWCYNALYLGDAAKYDSETFCITVEVTDYSWEGSYGTVCDATLALNGKSYAIRLYLKGERTLVPGDRITGNFRLRLTTDDGERDGTYHQGKGIFLLGYQTGTVTVTEAEFLPTRYYPAYLRLRLQVLLEELFPADTAGFARALLLGDSTGIDYETNTAFKVSGIRHIIAVSGLHVSILFSVVYLLTGKRRFLTAILGIPSLLLFAAVAGFTPSITRACIMQILMILALLFGREYDPATALAFACQVMLTANPLVITSVSFQLSVGCMIGIFLFSGRIKSYLMDPKRLGRFRGWRHHIAGWFSGSVSVSLSAMTLTTALTAVHFGTVSLVGPLSNLLVLWATTFVFYGILAVCLLGFFWTGAAKATAWAVSWLIRYILTVSGALAAFPLAAVYTKSDYIVAWLVFVYVLLAVFLILKKKQPLVLACCMALSLGCALTASWLEPLTDECRVTVLGVGQGQCILLQSGGRTFMVDCGGSYSEDAADMAAETLLSQGVDHIDGLILTHADADHSGGVAYFLSRIETDNLFLPAAEDEEGVLTAIGAASGGAVMDVDRDIRLEGEDFSLTIYGPDGESGNQSSLCVLFQTENCDILITGDRNTLGERLLMLRAELPELELLIVGHHGSKYSTGTDLLEATMPAAAVISVGENNSYGHPAQEVLDRLAAIGCAVYRTDRDGTIIYRG